ncbi:MAG: TRAM domain-containing protein [Synechococcus sp. ELA057]
MVDILILVLFLVSGAATGWLGVDLLPEQLLLQVDNIEGLRTVLGGFGAFFGLLAGFFFQQLRRRLMAQVRSMPTDLLISRAVGLILGLLVANLLLAPILLLPLPWEVVLVKPLAAVLSNVFFGVLGYNLAEVHGRTLLRLFNPNSTEALLVADGVLQPATAKILDTSVIIDGRISGLLDCGLLEGQVIVAQAVIDELQALADSANAEKRGKGRRGLKLLGDLRESLGRRMVINTTRYDGDGADEKLLRLTADTGGTLLTADFNLAQVAAVQQLKALNLSELVIALRPEVQPGDALQLKIVREGKEADQGIGYLEDGTMVVVEDARQRIGERLPVTVTGALQTPTGRMVFARCDRPAGERPANGAGERPTEKGSRSSRSPGGKAAPSREPLPPGPG